ncbi:MAG: hypothetical protein AB8H47_18650 [Bacteroidia bacterium]
MKISLVSLLLLLSLPLFAQRLAPLPDSMQEHLKIYQKLPSTHVFEPIDETEPGTPLLLMVEVFARDCDCPFSNEAIFMTQTSAAGVYDLSSKGDWTAARLKGTIQTDAKGRYLIRSILPGTYPNSTTANPHIHLMIEALEQPYYDIVFAPYLNRYGKRDLAKKPDEHFAATLWQGSDNQQLGYVRIYVAPN